MNAGVLRLEPKRSKIFLSLRAEIDSHMNKNFSTIYYV